MAGVGGLRQLRIAGGRFGGAHKTSEMIDIGEAIGARLVIGLTDGVAKVGDFVGLEAAGDPHFVEISVSGEGQKTGLLIFPAEAADGGLAGSFDDGNMQGLATDLVVVLLALLGGEVNESLIGDSFDKTVAQNIERYAESADFFGVWDAFLNFRAGEGSIRTDGAVVHERATFDDLRSASNGDIGIYELAMGAAVAHAKFADLAGAARGGILVTLAAGLRVVERAQAVGDGFRFLELGLIGGVGGVVRETVGLIVEAGGSFRERRSEREKSDGQQGHADEKFHAHLSGLAKRIYIQTERMPS